MRRDTGVGTPGMLVVEAGNLSYVWFASVREYGISPQFCRLIQLPKVSAMPSSWCD